MEVYGLRFIFSHKIVYEVLKLSMKPCRMGRLSMFPVLFVLPIFFLYLFRLVCSQFPAHDFLFLLHWLFSLHLENSPSTSPCPNPTSFLTPSQMPSASRDLSVVSLCWTQGHFACTFPLVFAGQGKPDSTFVFSTDEDAAKPINANIVCAHPHKLQVLTCLVLMTFPTLIINGQRVRKDEFYGDHFGWSLGVRTPWSV